jgi:N-methylhydantoinase B
VPLELQEALYPLRYEELTLRQDSGGAGKFRGGLGFRKAYRILAPCSLQILFDRIKCPPWGVLGGKEAMSGRVVVTRASGEQETIYKTKAYPLGAGDTVCVESGGGGGYGPPGERPRHLVERDLARGYISAEAAERDYGVVAEGLAPEQAV